jgi:hypothetical protein
VGNMERYTIFIEVSWSSLGVVLGDLVDVSAWGIISCVSKINTFGGGVGWGGVGAFCAGLERSTQLFIMNLDCK